MPECLGQGINPWYAYSSWMIRRTALEVWLEEFQGSGLMLNIQLQLFRFETSAIDGGFRMFCCWLLEFAPLEGETPSPRARHIPGMPSPGQRGMRWS
jgi:hypothetical protein